jgi:rhodanese-related sulfurtransferase
MDQLKELMKQDNVMILDARPAKAYEGQAAWVKAGHIPGAISLPWKSLMADDNPALLKSDQEIAQILKRHNITPDKTIVTYCGTGREATNPFLLFKCYLGFSNVKLYEGSVYASIVAGQTADLYVYAQEVSPPAGPTVSVPVITGFSASRTTVGPGDYVNLLVTAHAVPTLRKALDDPNAEIRKAATNSLRQIAPKALGNLQR